MNPAARRKAARQVLRSSLRARGREWRRLAAWSLLEALPSFLSGRLVAQAVDEGFLAGSTAAGLAWLGVLGACMLVGAWATRQTLRWLAALVEPFRDELAAATVTGTLRGSTLPGASPDTAGVARLTQQVEIGREAYTAVLGIVQGFLVTTVSALLGMLTLDPAILVLVVPPLLLGLGLYLSVLGRMAARRRASILADERIAEAVSAPAGGLRDVVACGAEEEVATTVGEHIDAQARATRAVARLNAVGSLAIAAGGSLPLLLILIGGSWLVDHGATTGVILGALTYVVQGVQPAMRTLVRGLAGPGLWLLVSLGRIAEASGDQQAARYRESPRRPARPHPQHLGVRLSDVTFAYGPSAEPVIRGLDLTVPEDDHLAVVGPSGVGKSTLAGLISGLLEPQAGQIRIGGVPLRQLDAATLVRLRTLIPQEAYVFDQTLWENLTYLRDDATRREIDRAVDELGIRPLVERIGGYWTYLQPPALSAGERQLITLVRAYLSPAPLVVLDEATCHLDPTAEEQVEQAFRRRPGTLIVIAHRISSALRARRILVLDGTQALLGTHEDLVAQSALYRDLVGYWHPGGAFSPDRPPVGVGNGLRRAPGPRSFRVERIATRSVLERVYRSVLRLPKQPTVSDPNSDGGPS